MTILSPYPRGFLMSKATAEVQGPSDWKSIVLGGSGWVFTHEPSLLPRLEQSSDGRDWVLIHGLYLPTRSTDRLDDVAATALAASMQGDQEFWELLDSVGGRYTVVRCRSGHVEVYHDAIGARSVYYSESEDLISSHAFLIQETAAHPARSPEEGSQGFITGWDRTPFIGISALLPNHSLHPASWSVVRYFPRTDNRYVTWTHQERLAEFIRIWNRQLEHIKVESGSVILSITGGADSRTTLALSRDHLEDFRTFTYTRRPSRSRSSASLALDKTIVDNLKSTVEIPNHRYFMIEDEDSTVPDSIRSLLAKNSIGNHGSWLIPHYLKAFPEEGCTHLRGFGYEIGRAYWIPKSESNSLAGLWALHRSRLNRRNTPENPESQRRNFDEGIHKWDYRQEMHGYNIYDIYYWEARVGRWGAEVLNETDIAFQTVVPINTRELLEITLSYPLEKRRQGFLFSELINESTPILNFLGKNDERNLYEIERDARLQAEAEARNPTFGRPLMVPEALVTETFGRPGPTRPSPDGELLVQQEDFRPGTRTHLEFPPQGVPGCLRFTVNTRYKAPTGRGRWNYQIRVDGTVLASWDGAIWNDPAHIHVSNLPAGANVSVTAQPIRDMSAYKSWSEATRAWITELEFREDEPEGDVSVGLDAPHAHIYDLGRPDKLQLSDLPSLNPDDLIAELPIRVDVEFTAGTLPLLVVRRENADRVVIMSNGAVDTSRTKGTPVFQRSSWWMDIPAHQIYICDPGTVGPAALSLAWGQISSRLWAVPAMSEAVQHIARALGTGAPADRTYFGSSAGGFLSIAMTALDPGSSAIVNNAQIDWTRWMAGGVSELRNSRFDGMLPAQLQAELPTRTNVLNLLTQQKQAPVIDYWVNTASPHDREVDLPVVQAFIDSGSPSAAHIHIHTYEDPHAGHNPMDRAATVNLIRSACHDG